MSQSEIDWAAVTAAADRRIAALLADGHPLGDTLDWSALRDACDRRIAALLGNAEGGES
jgi:hypothetical protein